MSNKNDDYIDKFNDEHDPRLTDRGLFGPLVYGGFAILCIIGYILAVSTGELPQAVIILSPVFASKGLIVSAIRRQDRFTYPIFWRIGFYSCAGSLAVSLVIIMVLTILYSIRNSGVIQ